MKASVFVPLIFLASCNQKQEETKAFDLTDSILNTVIEHPTNEYVEFPTLYDTLPSAIPEDPEENLILVQKLEDKGFKVTNWGRGNHRLGPRLVSVTLIRDSCECEVVKLYYALMFQEELSATERIKCRSYRPRSN